jgi:hypothetical protein
MLSCLPCFLRVHVSSYRDADSRPHPSQRKVFPPQLLPEDVEDSEMLSSAFRFRSPDPTEDEPGAGAEWLDLPVESEGLARMATADNLLPGTRYRFRLIFRPRLSKKYKRRWVDWLSVPLSDWFRTDGACATHVLVTVFP